jgi:hypothetical protein
MGLDSYRSVTLARSRFDGVMVRRVSPPTGTDAGRSGTFAHRVNSALRRLGDGSALRRLIA